MANKGVQGLYKLVRDLLQFSEDNMSIGRHNAIDDNFKKDFITVDSLGVAQRQTKSQGFNNVIEYKTYSQQYLIPCTIDFYGANAYENADKFSCLLMSEFSSDKQLEYEIAVYLTSGITDLRALLGKQYANRVQIQLNVSYTASYNVDTRRIDTAVITVLQENGQIETIDVKGN